MRAAACGGIVSCTKPPAMVSRRRSETSTFAVADNLAGAGPGVAVGTHHAGLCTSATDRKRRPQRAQEHGRGSANLRFGGPARRAASAAASRARPCRIDLLPRVVECQADHPCPLPTYPVSSPSTAATCCASPGCSCATRRWPRTSCRRRWLAALVGQRLFGQVEPEDLAHRHPQAQDRRRDPQEAARARRRGIVRRHRRGARHRGLRRAVQQQGRVGAPTPPTGAIPRRRSIAASSSTSWTSASKSCRRTRPACS